MRNTGSSIAVAVPNDTSVVASQAPVEEQVVSATLITGDYSTEIVGANWWSWKAAAGQLANAIEKWVKENKEQVIARRPKGN